MKGLRISGWKAVVRPQRFVPDLSFLFFAMLQLEPHADGVILPVRAQPGARRNELRGEQDGQLKVCVTQSPERGKANKAIVELLSKSLRLKKSQIELLSGETSHQKRFLVRQVTVKELTERLGR
ncbi:MAG: DUF167 domain-containing protein [Thermoguttaceae bacterium]